MSSSASIIVILVSQIFVNNYVMSRFMGICPFLGVSKKLDSALGMGIAVTFVMTISSAFTYLVYTFILVPAHVEYLYNIAFILVIAALVQFVEMFIRKNSPALYSSLGIYLPLITTNCAVLGVAVLNMQYSYNLLQSVVSGFAGGLGFLMGIVLFSAIRERIDESAIPEAFRGFPIAMISAGLMAIAFLGFQGMV